MSDLEGKIDRLTRLLARQQNFWWMLWRGLLNAIISTVGAVLVLSAVIYILRRANLVPGFDLFVDELLPTLERLRK